MDIGLRLAGSAGRAAARPTFSHQSAPGRTQNVDDACADERVSELSLSLWRKTCLRADRDFRKPARRKNVRTLWLQSFEPGRDHEIQKVLSAIGLSQHRDQESGNG